MGRRLEDQVAVPVVGNHPGDPLAVEGGEVGAFEALAAVDQARPPAVAQEEDRRVDPKSDERLEEVPVVRPESSDPQHDGNHCMASRPVRDVSRLQRNMQSVNFPADS